MYQRLKYFSRVLLVCSLATSTANAYLLNNETIPTALLLNNFDSASPAARHKEAQKLLNNLNALSATLPKQNPFITSNLDRQRAFIEESKKKFLESIKRKSVDNESFGNELEIQQSYDNNPDHYLYELAKEIDLTKSSLKCVLNAKDTRLEMYCWTLTSVLLLEDAVWEQDIKKLIRNKQIENFETLSNEGLSLKLDELHRTYHNYAISILWKIILPYMKTFE